MGDPGSVGSVLSLERRESSGEDMVAARPLEELLLWSCCSVAGRRSEKWPKEPRSVTGLVGDDST